MARILPSVTLLLSLAITYLSADEPNLPATPSTKPSGKFWIPTNDVGIGSDGKIKDQDSYQARIGELNAPGGEAYILPLRLPKLADGQHIESVHLRTQLVALNNEAGGLANADLYGLGVREAATALPSDYYQGSKPDPKATLLQAKFLTPTSAKRTDPNAGPFIETSSAGDAALVKYLNETCAQPGSAGKFVFFRISYDADTIPNGNSAYLLLTTGASGDNEPPIFTYTLSASAKH